jgi:hypothetical protein
MLKQGLAHLRRLLRGRMLNCYLTSSILETPDLLSALCQLRAELRNLVRFDLQFPAQLLNG